MTYNSIDHILKNRRYRGEYKYRDIVVPDGIPAIVPKDLFETGCRKKGVAARRAASFYWFRKPLALPVEAFRKTL